MRLFVDRFAVFILLFTFFKISSRFRTACVVIVVITTYIEGEAVGCVIGKTLADIVGYEACRHRAAGLVSVLVGVVHLPVVGFPALVGGVGREFARIDVCVDVFAEPSLAGIMGVVGYVDRILGIVGNDVDNTADRVATIKGGSGSAQDLDAFHIPDVDTGITVVASQSFTVFEQ